MNNFSENQRRLIDKLQRQVQDLRVFRLLKSRAAFTDSLQSDFVDQLLLCVETDCMPQQKSYFIVAASDNVDRFEKMLATISASLDSEEYALLSIYESGIAGRHDVGTLNFI